MSDTTHGATRRRQNTRARLLDAAHEVFGEVGMMTGEPRRATLIARGYAQCYRLDKGVFEQVIHSRPEIAEEVARILATRERQLSRFQESPELRATTEISQRTQSILEKMREFFGFR